MSDTLLSEIRAGLGVTSWDDSIDAVQTTIANALNRLDRRVQIHRTGYFNHTFVPDFALTWPGAEASKRDIFLRLGMSPDALVDDLSSLDKSDPILLDVGETISKPEARGLAAVIDGRDALVADPMAVDALAPQHEGRYTDVLSSTMLKGGRGVIGGAEAVSLKLGAETFFKEAEAHNRQQVERSVRTLFPYLSTMASRRLANLGRIAWEVSGGSRASYPLMTPDADATDDDTLLFALHGEPAGDPEFWRALGASLTFHRLVNLDDVRTTNLRYLVAANIDRLEAGAVVVRPHEPVENSSGKARHAASDADHDTGARWFISNGALLYLGTSVTVYVVPSRRRATDNDEWKPRLADLIPRLGVLPVESVSVATPDGRSISVKSASHLDIIADDTLRNLLDGPTVAESVGIWMSQSTALTCCFANLSAYASDQSTNVLARLLRASLPVLMRLPNADVAEMRWMMEYNAQVRPLHLPVDDDLGPW